MRPGATVRNGCLGSVLLCAGAGCAIDARDTRITPAALEAPLEAGDLRDAAAPPPSLPNGDYGSTGDELLDSLLTGFTASPLAEDDPDCSIAPEEYPGRELSASIYRGQARYGKAIWMRGTSGTCAGKQWIRFELDVAVPGPLELRYVTEEGEATVAGYNFAEGLPAGTFDAQVTRYSRPLCGLLSVPGEPRDTWPVFGNYKNQTPRENLIPGTMC